MAWDLGFSAGRLGAWNLVARYLENWNVDLGDLKAWGLELGLGFHRGFGSMAVETIPKIDSEFRGFTIINPHKHWLSGSF